MVSLRVRRPSRAPNRSVRTWLLALAALAGGCARREPPGSSALADPQQGAAVASAGGAEADPSPDEEPGEDAGAGVIPGTIEIPSGPGYEPVENGPFKIGAVATQAWIHAGPNDETTSLGYLRVGAIVDRAEKPVAVTKRCKGGWYRVAPRGFVCNGKRATIDLDNPILVASWKPPARGAPLPYLYARPKESPPYLYFRVPSAKDQERAEGVRVSDQIKLFPKERFLPIVGTVDPIPPFLEGGKALPKPFGATQRLRYGAHEGKANPHSAFAFQSVHDDEGRLFGLSTDLNLIALDRVNLVKETDIHGGEIADLPAAIVTFPGAPKYKLDEHGIPHEDGKLVRFQTVSFTGVTKGDLWESTDGYWVSTQGLLLIKKRDSYPSFVHPEAPKKWIDVSIHHQLLVAYEGQRAVYVAQVSTGLGEMSDPEKTTATKRGTFTIKSKHVTALMTGEQVGDDYELSDVPYVQYFEAGYALHAAYWHEAFGHVRSHGCVNLPPRDAAWLFEWTEPEVPKGWHGVQTLGEGTVVVVRY